MTEYKLFIPPEHLAEKGRKNWNKKEAEEYKEWLLSVIDNRISNLLNFFNEQESNDDIHKFLLRLSKKVSNKLNESGFSAEIKGQKKLTNMGYALAADMGLLIAKYLLRDCGNKLYWTIIRKPKSEMSYNLPVLEIKGFDYYEPVGVSISDATSIINDNKDYDVWLKVYNFIKDNCSSHK